MTSPGCDEIHLTEFNSLQETRGTRRVWPWAELVSSFCDRANVPVAKDKKALPLWSAATFRNDHALKSNVEFVHALCMDFDTLKTFSSLVEFFRSLKWMAIVATTFSHAPDAPRARAVLSISRPVNGTEYDTVIRRFIRVIADNASIQADDKCIDPSRRWFVPAVSSVDAAYEAVALDGRAFDVDTFLQAAAKDPIPTRVKYVYPDAPLDSSGKRRVISFAVAEIEATPDGARNDKLNRMAFWLAHKGLREHEVLSALAGVAEHVGLKQHEIAATIRSAVRGARKVK